MTGKQPEALRLATVLMTLFPSREDGERASAELRRLHAENETLKTTVSGWINANNPYGWIDDLRKERDELLKALKMAVRQNEHDMIMTGEECRQCRDAIAKVEEQK